jgi:hypothetical protein
MLEIETEGTADRAYEIGRRIDGMLDQDKEMAQKIIDLFLESRTTVSREIPFAAKAETPNIDLNNYIEMERMLIQLKSRFESSEERDNLIAILGHITESNVRETGDDGFSQAVTVQQGISLKESKTVPSIVKLAPYRTFLEVPQTESEFLVRLKNGPTIALFEADGGAWKFDAVKNIKEYFEEALEGVEGIIIVG